MVIFRHALRACYFCINSKNDMNNKFKNKLHCNSNRNKAKTPTMGVCLSYPKKRSANRIANVSSREHSTKCSTPLISSRPYDIITQDVLEMYRHSMADGMSQSTRGSSGTDISVRSGRNYFRHISMTSYNQPTMKNKSLRHHLLYHKGAM